jgi:hypothetical protein
MIEPGRDAVDTALECRPGREYDESAFLYFLGVERSRADRSNQALRLLLVTVEPTPGRPRPMGRAIAVRLVAGLRATLRETDVVGWYRQHCVAGAVLSARTDAPGTEMSSVIRQRVGEGLRRQLPSSVVHHLRVRVIELRRPSGNG